MRVDADGAVRHVRTDPPVTCVQADADALHVRVLDSPWHLTPRGGSWEVTWIARWLRLPHDAQVPDTLDLATFAVAGGKEPAPASSRSAAWIRLVRDRAAPTGAFGEPAVDVRLDAGAFRAAHTATHGHRRRRVRGRPGGAGLRPRTRARHHDGSRCRRGAAGGCRTTWLGPRGTADAPVEVLRLSPTGERGVLLPAESVDISGHRWPLVPRPPEADSYVRQVLDSWGELGLAPGLSAARLRLVGEWPGTQLECSFDVPSRPGLRLRRRIPLFDELGRTADPRHAGTHRLETVETGGLPPSSAAVDGVLDV